MARVTRQTKTMNERASADSNQRFDDRVDINTEISSLEALVLMGRSFRLLRDVKILFAVKFLLGTIAIFPILLVPWLGKIIIDQVLLQKPFGETEVTFPPFMDPLLAIYAPMGPMEIMGSIVVLLAVLITLFGVIGGGTGVRMNFTQGQDNATQSEAALSGGGSTAGGLLGITEMMVSIRLSQNIANRLRTCLFKQLTRLSMQTLDDHRIGDSIYRVMYDTPMIPEICYKLSFIPFITALSIVINVGLMQYSYGAVAPELVWIAALMAPLTLVVTLPMSGFARRINQRSRASGAATTNAMEESIDNIGAIQSLSGMDQEKERFSKKSSESYKHFLAAFLFEMSLFAIGYGLVIAVGLYVAIYITDGIISGTMSAGDFSVMFGIFFSLGMSCMTLGKFWIDLQTNVAAARRVFFFIDFSTEDLNRDEKPDKDFSTSIKLKEISFRYTDGNWALRNINVELKIGELIAIVGPTGAGKTSLGYMLPGFLKPTEGQVFFDGKDIAKMNTDWLRNQVSYVFQEHILFSDSIRDNLLIANPHASEAQMIHSLRTAGAWEFIQELPERLDTVLGKGGNTLSVGQQQRLCIARGLVRDTRILILDEPTAALDPDTENALVNSLKQAAEGRLVIVIAHRLSTIRQATKILFLQDGEVLEQGSHKELMADKAGHYRRFVDLQANPDY